MGDLVPADGSNKPVPTGGQRKSNFLKQLPPEWRKPVGYFWAFNGHLLPDAMELAARLRVWREKDGLTLPDLIAVIRTLVQPERSARHQFPGQLMADLAAEVAKVVGRRKSIEAMLRRRTRPEVIVTETDPIQQVLDRVGQPTHTGDAP